MKLSNAPSLWRAIILGAINGLLAGGMAYTILWFLVEYENQRLREKQLSGGVIMHVSVGIDWWDLPFIGLIAFTVGSFLVHKYLAHRIKSIVLLWQCVGGASVICGILFLMVAALIDHRSGARPIDFENLNLLGLVWSCLAVFAYVSVINLLYGAFIQMLVTQYSRKKRTEFP